MSDYQCQICTGTRGWHTSGCKQVSQELAALRQRVAELEAQLSALDDSHKRTLTNLSDTDEARIGQIAQLKAQRELITSLTNENEQLQSLYEEACEERDTAVESKNFYASQIAELEAATPTLELVGGEWGYNIKGDRAYRDIGEWNIRVVPHLYGSAWRIAHGCEACGGIIAEGTAPTREAAIEAAEKALLVEVGKFVRVAGRQAEVTKRQDIAGSADTL